MTPGSSGAVNTTLPLVLSIVGFFFCATHLFGIVAFIFAMIATNSNSVGNFEDARSKAKISIIVSVVGFALNLLVGLAIGLLVMLGIVGTAHAH
jgi:NhaP-type Na+/H+ or K+/H+ antiporter